MRTSGRVVIPKAVRKQAGLTPGTELEVRFIDDRIELEPCYSKVRLEDRDGWLVAVVDDYDGPKLTTEDVERIRQEIYDERFRDFLGDSK